MIRLTNLALSYDRGPDVLSDINFHLRPGSFHFLTGPSGAGKTSLLRLMFMSLAPTHGQIHLFNQDISHINAAKRAQLRRRIGIVFQDSCGDLLGGKDCFYFDWFCFQSGNWR